MANRAETIWTTYEWLRRDVVLGDRCSSVCNETLINFVEAMASFYSAAPAREVSKTSAFLRYLCDDTLHRADRVMEHTVTGIV